MENIKSDFKKRRNYRRKKSNKNSITPKVKEETLDFDFWIVCDTEDQAKDVLNNKNEDIFTDTDTFINYYNYLHTKLSEMSESHKDSVFKDEDGNDVDGYLDSHFIHGNAFCIEWTVEGGLGTRWGAVKQLKSDFRMDDTIVLDYKYYGKLCEELRRSNTTRLTKELLDKFRLRKEYPVVEITSENREELLHISNLGNFIKIGNFVINKNQISYIIPDKTSIKAYLIGKDHPLLYPTSTKEICESAYNLIISYLK